MLAVDPAAFSARSGNIEAYMHETLHSLQDQTARGCRSIGIDGAWSLVNLETASTQRKDDI